MTFTVAQLQLIRRLCDAEARRTPLGSAARLEATETAAVAALLADACVVAAAQDGLLARVRRAKDLTSHVVAFGDDEGAA